MRFDDDNGGGGGSGDGNGDVGGGVQVVGKCVRMRRAKSVIFRRVVLTREKEKGGKKTKKKSFKAEIERTPFVSNTHAAHKRFLVSTY